MSKAQKAVRLPAKPLTPMPTEVEKLLSNLSGAINSAISTGFVQAYDDGVIHLTPLGSAVIYAKGWANGLTPEEVIEHALVIAFLPKK
ncbi:MAG: hypothetical protein EBS05_26595 [Proteobacteria bacterium]|nr:hypothetical protein [Pseudomonadota bacterium]